MTDSIVSPGENITPQIDLAGAVLLAERLYGIKVESAIQLDGYDDKNYHLKVSTQPNNQFITNLWPHGYVLKIMNSSDSKKLEWVEAQCKLMVFLENNEIRTPQPQKSCDGRLYCIENLQDKENKKNGITKNHIVRLLTYQHGTLMKDVPWSLNLHYKCGLYTAQVDLVLKDFHDPVYKQYSSLWLLRNVPKVKEYLCVIQIDEERSAVVKNVINQFEESILSCFSSLKSGMIHGDIHEQNLLCDKDSEGEWEITGLLDLGDSHHSPYVVELALSVTYMMIQSGDIMSGTHVIAGYCSLHPLPLQELKLLKVCVCARLCQSLVLGLYSHSLDHSNSYVLSTQAQGWKVLRQLWTIDNAQLEDLWFSLLPPSYNWLPTM